MPISVSTLRPTVLVGNLFDSSAQTLVNTVNCVGIMGKGVALEFKRRFPEMFADYAARCERREVQLGRPYIYRSLLPPHVLNFPTKGHWRGKTDLKNIVDGLEYLVAHYREMEITSLAVPPLGCGNGQLEWRVVGPTLYRHLARLEVPVEIYAPHGTPHEELRLEFLSPESSTSATSVMPEAEWIRPGWIVLVEILSGVLGHSRNEYVEERVFRHMAITASILGVPTELDIKRSRTGPTAGGWENLFRRVSANGIIEKVALKRGLGIRVGPTFLDARKAYDEQTRLYASLVMKIADAFSTLKSSQARLASLLVASESEAIARGGPTTFESLAGAALSWARSTDRSQSEAEIIEVLKCLAQAGIVNATPQS